MTFDTMKDVRVAQTFGGDYHLTSVVGNVLLRTVDGVKTAQLSMPTQIVIFSTPENVTEYGSVTLTLGTVMKRWVSGDPNIETLLEKNVITEQDISEPLAKTEEKIDQLLARLYIRGSILSAEEKERLHRKYPTKKDVLRLVLSSGETM